MVITYVFAFLCMPVRALKGKRLELSTPNLVSLQISSVAISHARRSGLKSKVKVTKL